MLLAFSNDVILKTLLKKKNFQQMYCNIGRFNMKKKNLTTKISITALAVLLGAGCTTSVIPPLAGLVVVHAEDQTSQTSSTVINENTVWKYLDDNTDPAAGQAALTAWTEKGFDDTAWKSAAGKFGAKRGALTSFDGFTPTILLQQYIDGTSTDIPTYFFRTTFTVDNLDQLTSITGTLFHDDAVAVYINGHLVKSVDMPTDTQSSNMFYAGVSAGAPKQADLSLSKEDVKNFLTEGENVLSVELHNDRESSSDIYFEFQNLTLNYNETSDGEDTTPVTPSITQKSVFLTVGSDTSSQGVTWYADTADAGEVQYAVKNGDVFPGNYQTAQAVQAAANDQGFYSNQATLTNLQPGSEYVYRVVNGDTVSDTYSFKTGVNDGSYSFAFVGDPQIGASGNAASDTNGWNETLNVITSKFNPDFLLSAGDQVNTHNNETQYAGYLNDVFTTLPSATSIGNHDSGSAAYSQHFNLPNVSADKGITNAGSDYWFVYENTLFIDINSNNRSNAEHKAFIQEAIDVNPNVKWKTVVFHHSIYSTASHVNDSDIINRRNELPQIFTDLDIDVVLMGHDHVYTRTYMMNGYTPDTSQGVQSSVTNPTGILYLTANSASGSKYYDIKAPNAEYSAKMDQSYRRTVTDIDVTDTSYTMTTYYADNMEVLDQFTINKTDNTALKTLVDETEAKNLSAKDYTEESWNTFQSALENAKNVLANNDAAQSDIDSAYEALENAVAGLKTPEPEEKPDDKTDNNKPGKDDNSGNNNNSGKDDNSGNNNNSDNNNNSGKDDNSGNNNNSGSNNSGSNNNSGKTGNTTTTNTNSGTVKTGDTSNVASAGLMMIAAGSVITVCFKKRKKFK